MELLKQIIDIFLHLDKHLSALTQEYGTWTYLILFSVIFVETGLVIMPFLPGDSLLFAAGAITALPNSGLNVIVLAILLFVAAVLGDALNYSIGRKIGPKVFERKYKYLNTNHLLKARSFYEKHGGKTIVIARFMPIVRTFAPFVAGVSMMNYGRFLIYNVVGGFLWVVSFVAAGYWFGNKEIVRKNFTLIILAIILISILPPIIEYIRHRRSATKVN